jgi:hypothetical protein
MPPLNGALRDDQGGGDGIFENFALPDSDYRPAVSAQPPSLGLIASSISRDLCDPEFLGFLAEASSERSHPAISQQPTVPEIAIDEYGYVRAPQDDIGTAAKNLNVRLKSDMFPAQCALQPYLRRSVFAEHSAHATRNIG